MSRIASFRSLPLGDQFRLVAATGLLVTAWIGVFILPFDHFRWLLIRAGDLGGRFIPGNPSARRIASAVDVADRYVPGGRTCLVRSLSTEVLLRAYGSNFTHRIGVQKSGDGTVQAHSWIECDEEILIGELDDLDAFEPLPPISNN